MKEIVPFSIYVNGQMMQVNFLSLACVNDNLINTAIFNYGLYYMDKSSQFQIPTALNQGQLTMTGTEYDNDWNTNDEAWNWAAKQMNVTFV